MRSPNQLVLNIETRFDEMKGRDMPLEVVGALLDDARRVYLGQLGEDGPMKRYNPNTQEMESLGPVVSREEVTDPFPKHLLTRLCKVIATIEQGFDAPDFLEGVDGHHVHVPSFE